MMKNLDSTEKIALKLSSLSKSDFDWVYSQLEGDVKNDLALTLKEIRDVGLKINAGDLSSSSLQDTNNIEAKKDEYVLKLNSSNYRAIANILKAEPIFLISTLINLENWSWKNDKEYLERQNPGITKELKNIKTRKLLEKSLISNAVTFLDANEQKNSNNNHVVETQINGLFRNYTSIFLRLGKKWKF